MVRVSGALRLVTSGASLVSQVVVRAPGVRGDGGGGLVTGEGDTVPVDNGMVVFECVPGPAVMVLVSVGAPVEVVRLLVPDVAQVSLEDCVRAATLADTATQSELDDLAARAVTAVRDAVAAAGSAQESAAAADMDAREVDAAREIIDGYRAQVVGLHGEVVAARGAASSAAEAATAQAETATDRAVAAAESAANAGESETSSAASAQTATQQADRATSEADRSKVEADRAAQSAADSSVKAVNDRVNALLAGAPEAYDTLLEVAEELARGQSAEAALTQAIAAKADKQHTHTTAQISDATAVGREMLTAANAEAARGAIGAASGAEVWELFIKMGEGVEMRPALFSGAGAPPSSIPGAVVGDMWLDTTTMTLHKITGV